MSGVETVHVSADEAGLRLDRWFKRHYPEVTHARLEKWLRFGQVRIDGRRARADARLEPGQTVRVPPRGEGHSPTSTTLAASPPVRLTSEAEAKALQSRVLHRDDHLIVIDKPAGLAVQGGTGTRRHLDAMLEALRFDGERPRLVHRLDKDTSGVLVLARTAPVAAELATAFRSRRVRKLYWAVVVGVPTPLEGRVDQPLAKQSGPRGERVAVDRDGEERAVTLYRVIERAGRRAAWLALEPLTGRTHQLRAHCAALGTPILGDGKYGGRGAFLEGSGLSRTLHLHARAITLPQPAGGTLTVEAPLPDPMRETWRFFGFSDKDSGFALAALEEAGELICGGKPRDRRGRDKALTPTLSRKRKREGPA